MSDDRHADQSARTLYGVIKVDGAMWRIADAPVMTILGLIILATYLFGDIA